MKIKFFLTALVCLSWIVYSGFSNNYDSLKWSQDPRTRIDLNPEGDYIDLPPGTGKNFSSETRYTSTPQGVYAVGPNFRVHPTASRTQSETPITRHPANPNIMFASANTFDVGGSTTFSTGHYVTTDGGVTFFGDDTTNFNYGDPAPMIMYTGRLLISYITPTGQMGAAYSVNNGATWSATVTFPGSGTFSDKNLSCTDGEPTSPYYGRCYTVFTDFGGTYAWRIVVSWSDNGGVTWSQIVPISPVPPTGRQHTGCDVTVDIFGWVRVVYANSRAQAGLSTEDSLGWAESSNGGVSWSDMSSGKVNTNGIRTTDLLPSPPAGIIRVNGFPRIDGDRTCNPSAGDQYVVMAEKNFAPALDSADIVLMKTRDGGSTWTRVRVNQNAAGSYEWFPAVNVDETGAVNVCYYSTRNTPTNDSAEIYLSRSTDGGVTFVDVLISDHKFKPLPISGTAPAYQGDYIGITSGGAGKIIPYWCEQNPSTGGRYQAYASLVDIAIGNPCEDFSCAKNAGSSTLPLFGRNLYEQFSGTNYWARLNTTAYNVGSGSARFNSWSASSGVTQSLITYHFPAAVASTYLTFDHAYASRGGGPLNIDSLIIESSANGGTSYSTLTSFWGGANGNLNTAPPGGQFTPTGGQWRPKIFLLPAGTNKIRFRAVSGFGNDIWVDNICVITGDAIANSISIAPEGMLLSSFPYLRMNDTVRVYLHRSDFPNVKVDSAISTINDNGVAGDLLFSRALTGNYYRVVKHRNTIETWQAIGTAYTRGGSSHWNFIQPSGQAFGNNQKLVWPLVQLGLHGMFSGDIDQNGFIDLTDVTGVNNDALAFATGYRRTDVTGDNITDLNDLIITYNNNVDFVSVVRPPGAEPAPAPFIELNDKGITFENDAQREKYEMTKRFLEEQKNIVPEKVTPNWISESPENHNKRSELKPQMRNQNTETATVGNP